MRVDPNEPYARILELQDTIDTYHRANLEVIMDVVYNHVYQADESMLLNRSFFVISTVIMYRGRADQWNLLWK